MPSGRAGRHAAGQHNAAAESSVPVANESGLRALGEQIDKAHPGGTRRFGRRARRPPRSRTRRRVYWVLGVLGVVIVLLAGAVVGYAWYLNHEIHRIKVKDLSATATKGVDVGTQNILMVGSTSRCALTVQNPAYGLCSQGVNGVNSDVIMILHLDSNKHTVSILSIPRDLFVPNARQDGANKIDAALYEGPSQLVDAIQEDFGIPINHYVELNFDTFANVVNALGGIKMYFPMPVYDAYSGLNIQTTGCLTLNGVQALQVVRARHLQYKTPSVTSDDPSTWPQENESDLARILRDHEFLRVLAASVAKRGLGNPITDSSLVSAVAPQLTVDSGFSASDMISMVLEFHGVNTQTAPQWTLPVMVDENPNGYNYQGSNYGDVEFTSEPQDLQIVDQFLGVSSDTNTMTGTPLPAPGTVSVSVQNGTGVYNQASDTASALQGLGFDVVSTGDTTPVGTDSETVVYYGSTTPTAEAAAQAVARSLSGAVILSYDPSQVVSGSMVTVVTGSDFSVNPPAPAPSTGSTAKGSATTATTAPPTTTTTTTPNATSSDFTAPSAAVQPLAPWDPRSCTPSGGEGP